MSEEEYFKAQADRRNSATERQKRKSGSSDETLCWKCRNFYCSWIQDMIPVRNWKADRTEIICNSGRCKRVLQSYFVYECPEFKPE